MSDSSIKTLKNLYRGVNPHLQSLLQTPGSEDDGLSLWPSFHSRHVTHIADFLTEVLPPGYAAYVEQSLQIRAEDVEAELRTRKPEPDVTIYRQSPGTHRSAAPAAFDAPLVMALDDTLDLTEGFVKAVVIREVREDARLGRVVTRIELLSPSNKPGHVGYEAYRKARNDALYSRVPLIELDYLHESPPTAMNYPIYPHQPGSHPYSILISDPRPSVSQGRFLAHGFDVDSPFPITKIPLLADETLEFNFGEVYHYTYRRAKWGTMVDYAQPPLRFMSYSTGDQARIEQRMALIAEAHARGEDLDVE